MPKKSTDNPPQTHWDAFAAGYLDSDDAGGGDNDGSMYAGWREELDRYLHSERSKPCVKILEFWSVSELAACIKNVTDTSLASRTNLSHFILYGHGLSSNSGIVCPIGTSVLFIQGDYDISPQSDQA